MEVTASKSVRLVVAAQHGVEGVDITHVVHEAESKVLLDVGSAVHPRGNGVHECIDLRQISLRASSEVLYWKWLVTIYGVVKWRLTMQANSVTQMGLPKVVWKSWT